MSFSPHRQTIIIVSCFFKRRRSYYWIPVVFILAAVDICVRTPANSRGQVAQNCSVTGGGANFQIRYFGKGGRSFSTFPTFFRAFVRPFRDVLPRRNPGVSYAIDCTRETTYPERLVRRRRIEL